MTALLYAPVVLSILVLGAHFLRTWSLLLVVATVSLLALLFMRRRWAARIVQIALWLAAVEWIRALVVFSRERIAQGEPYRRLVVILGSVALFTLLSSLVFFTKRFRGIYRSAADRSVMMKRGGGEAV